MRKVWNLQKSLGRKSDPFYDVDIDFRIFSRKTNGSLNFLLAFVKIILIALMTFATDGNGNILHFPNQQVIFYFLNVQKSFDVQNELCFFYPSLKTQFTT